MGLLLELVHEVRLRIKPETLPWPRTTRTTRSLPGRGFGYWANEQTFNSYPGVVDLLFGEARINDVYNSIYRQGGFSNIGGDNDFSAWGAVGSSRSWCRVEDTLLLLRG